MVSEHRDDRDLERTARVGEDRRLLREAVRRQVAGEQDEVGSLFDSRERTLDPLAKRLSRVDVACGRDANGRGHRGLDTRRARSPNAKTGYQRPFMSSQTREIQHVLIATMKQAAAALRDAEIEFMLGGGLAAWARGGPPTDHDVDFYIRAEDAESAARCALRQRFQDRAATRRCGCSRPTTAPSSST